MNDATNLFFNNEKLVYLVFNRCRNKLPADYFNMYYDDLLQEAKLGLWKACMTYDATKGYNFSTLACTCIERRILNYAEKDLRRRRKELNPQLVSLNDVLVNNEHETVERIETIEAPTKIDLSWIFDDKRLTEKELLVCKMKYERYTDEEISKVLNCSISYPSRILKKVGKKLNDVR